jgi:hypothetical protein
MTCCFPAAQAKAERTASSEDYQQEFQELSEENPIIFKMKNLGIPLDNNWKNG